MGWQQHQLGHMQIICTSLQTDNHDSTSTLSFYRPDALPTIQPTASKHWRHDTCNINMYNYKCNINYNVLMLYWALTIHNNFAVEYTQKNTNIPSQRAFIFCCSTICFLTNFSRSSRDSVSSYDEPPNTTLSRGKKILTAYHYYYTKSI